MLESNLREIYHAVKFSEGDVIPLVSNLSETRVYDSRYGWGRLWRWVYACAEWITGNDYRLQKLKKTICHTQALFQQHVFLLTGHLKNYHQYLTKSGKGYYVNEGDYFAAREAITQWNASNAPFVNMARKMANGNQHTALKPLLASCFPGSPPNALKELFSPQIAIELQKCQSIIDLEGLASGPLPLAIFRKIFRKKPLNPSETKELEQWIWKINQVSPEAKRIHQAFESLGAFWSKPGKETLVNQSYLLDLYLEDKGCRIFQQEDPKHMRWRQQLKPGTKIPFGKADITLGEELLSGISGSERTCAYALIGMPDQVALIAQNKTILPLRNLRMRQNTVYGLSPALMNAMTPDGRVALMPRLNPLNKLKWKSLDKISPEDLPVLDKLTQLMRTLISANMTPANFSPNHIMLDKQQQLKILRPIVKGPFDFNALEEFALQSAAGNAVIFHSLMTSSGLSQHPAAKFYLDLMTSTLNGDVVDPNDLAGIYQIADPKVVDRGKALSEEIKIMQSQLAIKLKATFPEIDNKKLQRMLTKALISCHQAHKSASTLWPSLAEETLLKCTDGRLPPPRAVAAV